MSPESLNQPKSAVRQEKKTCRTAKNLPNRWRGRLRRRQPQPGRPRATGGSPEWTLGVYSPGLAEEELEYYIDIQRNHDL